MPNAFSWQSRTNQAVSEGTTCVLALLFGISMVFFLVSACGDSQSPDDIEATAETKTAEERAANEALAAYVDAMVEATSQARPAATQSQPSLSPTNTNQPTAGRDRLEHGLMINVVKRVDSVLARP